MAEENITGTISVSHSGATVPTIVTLFDVDERYGYQCQYNSKTDVLRRGPMFWKYLEDKIYMTAVPNQVPLSRLRNPPLFVIVTSRITQQPYA